MFKGKKANDLAAREQNGDQRAANEPQFWLAMRRDVDWDRVAPVHDGEIVIFIKRELFADGARGFGQWRGDTTINLEEHYRFMLELVFFLSVAIGDGLVKEVFDSREKQTVAWTEVMSEDDSTVCVGFLVRLTYRVAKEDVCLQVESHVSRCESAYASSIVKGKPNKFMLLPNHYMKMNRSAYLDMMDCYKGSDTDRLLGFDPINLENPYNPFAVFNWNRAIDKMKSAGAASAYCDKLSWFNNGSLLSFPLGGKHTVQLTSPSQMNPMILNKIHFPHRVRRMESTFELNVFCAGAGLKDAGHESDDDSEAGAAAAGLDRAQSKEQITQLYHRLASSSEMDEANDIDSVRRRCNRIMNEAMQSAGDDPRERAHKRREAQQRCLDVFFRDVFNDDDSSDAGDALKKIAGWYKNFLRENSNFRMHTPKRSCNLTRFGDALTREASALESAWSINTTHQEIKSVRVACLHVYWYSPFHAHTALLGPPGCGKSKVVQICLKRLIDGTYRDIGSETSKAKMTPGNKTDMMIEAFEDIPPNQLGITSYSNNRNAAPTATSNTDGESLLKYRLTKGRIFGTYKVVKDGKHMMLEIESLCNTVMLAGMNSAKSQIPSSVSSRFNCLQFQYKDRVDRFNSQQGIFNRYIDDKHPRLDSIRKKLLVRDHRDQCFHAMIGLCIYLGIFAEPSMDVASVIWNHALAVGKRRGLHETGNIRHLERLYFYCQTLMIDDAIDRVLDSELSPLPGDRPWHRYDLLEFEKHLYSNTEHASVSLGLLQHQWEDPIVAALEGHFKTVLLKEKIRNREYGKLDTHDPIVRQQTMDYYVLKAEQSSAMNSLQMDYAKSQGILIQRFADMCHSTMNPKPDIEEIRHALTNMMALHLEIDDTTRADGTKRIIPSFCFSRDGDPMIAIAMMENYAPNRLMNCLRQVLCHRFTHPKNIIYGQMLPATPWVYHVLKVEPDPENSLKLTRVNFHSDDVIGMTHELIATVGSSSKVNEDSDVPEQLCPSLAQFSRNFSKTPYQYVDMDLDEMASKAQSDRIGLQYFPPTRDAPNCNTSIQSFTSHVNRVVEHLKGGETERPVYPLCFEQLKELTFHSGIKRKERENPDMFSLANDVYAGRDRKRQMRERDLQQSTRAVSNGDVEMVEGEEMKRDQDEIEEHADGFVEATFDHSASEMYIDGNDYLDDEVDDDTVASGQPMYGQAANDPVHDAPMYNGFVGSSVRQLDSAPRLG